MRLLVVCRDAAHASSRVRGLQFVAPLRDLGHEVDTLVWQPRRTVEVAKLSSALLARARRADVVLLVKPRLHPAVLRALRAIQPNLVVDLDDAVWTWPAPFPARFDAAARVARTVVVGNEFLGQRVREHHPGVRVTTVPTAVDTSSFVPRPHAPTERLVVGWIGGPAS